MEILVSVNLMRSTRVYEFLGSSSTEFFVSWIVREIGVRIVFKCEAVNMDHTARGLLSGVLHRGNVWQWKRLFILCNRCISHFNANVNGLYTDSRIAKLSCSTRNDTPLISIPFDVESKCWSWRNQKTLGAHLARSLEREPFTIDILHR